MMMRIIKYIDNKFIACKVIVSIDITEYPRMKEETQYIRPEQVERGDFEYVSKQEIQKKNDQQRLRRELIQIERQRREKMKEILADVQTYSGNLLPSDLFIINDQSFIDSLQKINLQSQTSSRGIYFPYFNNLDLALQFLNKFLPPKKFFFFNIHADIQNTEQLCNKIKNKQLSHLIYSNINEIHIYNHSLTNFYTKYQQLNNTQPKIKALHNSFTQHVEQLKHSLQYRVKFLKVNGIYQRMVSSNKNFWNPFLTVDDLTFNASYRGYRLANMRMIRQNQGPCFELASSQIIRSQKDFENYIQKLRDSAESDQKKQILTRWQLLKQYLDIDRKQKSYLKIKENRIKVMSFYKAQSFYYHVLNTMLKICRTPSELKHIALPAAQTSVVIKDMYDSQIIIKQDQGQFLKRPKYDKLYRGTRGDNFQNYFKVGQVYQTLGYLSFSKQFDMAEKFCQAYTDRCLYMVRVPERVMKENELRNDNGFFQYSKIQNDPFFKKFMEKLKSSTLECEDEVLFNQGCLLKFQGIDTLNQIRVYNFVYVTIEQLEEEFETERQQIGNKNLTQSFIRKQKTVSSYRFYKLQYAEIEDKGDLLRHAQQWDSERKYYKQLLQKNKSTNIKLKHLDAELRCGSDLSTIQTSLKAIIKDNLQQIFMQKNLKNKVKSILKSLQKHSDYQILLEKQIIYLSKDSQHNYLQIAQALNEQGEIYLFQEKLLFCKPVLAKSLQIINSKITHLEQLRTQLCSTQQEKQAFHSCWNGFCQAFCIRKRQEFLSQSQKEQKIKEIKAELMKNLELSLKASANLIECHQKIDKHPIKKQNCQLLNSLYKKSNDYMKQYIAEIGGQEKLALEFRIIKLKIQLLSSMLSDISSRSKSKRQYFCKIQKLIKEESQKNPNSQKVADLTFTLASAKNSFLSSSIKDYASTQFTTSAIDSTQINLDINDVIGILKTTNKNYLDEKKINQTNEAYESEIKKSINIMLARKGPHHPSTLSKRFALSQHFHENRQIKSSHEQLQSIIQSPTARSHIFGVKSYLLLGQTYLCRGELNKAQEQFYEAENVLRQIEAPQSPQKNFLSIISELCAKRDKSRQVESYPLYFDIKIRIASVHRKKKDAKGKCIVFEQLIGLKKLVEEYLDESLRNRYLSQIFQLMAQIHASLPGSVLPTTGIRELLLSQNYNFIHLFQQSQKYLLEKGQSSLEVGGIYCMIAKILISNQKVLSKDRLDLAKQYLDKAILIFSKYPANHPQNWAPILTIFYLNYHERKKKPELKLFQFRHNNPQSQLDQTNCQIKIETQIQFPDDNNNKNIKCLTQAVKFVNKRFDRDHINYLNVKIIEAEFLSQIGKLQNSIIIELIQILDKDPQIKQITQSQIPKGDKNQAKINQLTQRNEKTKMKMKLNKIKKQLQLSKQSKCRNDKFSPSILIPKDSTDVKIQQKPQAQKTQHKYEQKLNEGPHKNNNQNKKVRTAGVKLSPINKSKIHEALDTQVNRRTQKDENSQMNKESKCELI